MKTSFDLLFATRKLLGKIVQDLSLEEVNKVPLAYNNSIGWNLAHILVTQQLLHYKLSGKELLLADSFVERFRKGSTGDAKLSEEEWADCQLMLKGLAEELERDYFEKKFPQYTTYPTSYGYEIHTIEEAIQFNNLHEALHLGYIMSMKKSVSKASL